MPPKTDNKLDEQTIFLFYCFESAKENAGKVNNEAIAKTLGMGKDAIRMRLARLTKTVKAQIEADGTGNDTPANTKVSSPTTPKASKDNAVDGMATSTVKKARMLKANEVSAVRSPIFFNKKRKIELIADAVIKIEEEVDTAIESIEVTKKAKT